MKRLKIVAKWHLNGGLHVPRCRTRFCIRPVLAPYSNDKRKRRGAYNLKKACLPVSGQGEPPNRADSRPSCEQACRTKGSRLQRAGEWDWVRVTQRQRKIWLLDLGDSEMLVDEVTNETPDTTNERG